MWDKIESAGYAVTGAIAKPGFRAKLRDIRNEINAPVFLPNLQATGQYTLDGIAITFPDNGGFAGTADLIVGDWSKAVYAIRQDITVKILTEGVIQDPTTKDIVYNLAQQDMVALRVFRMGWPRRTPRRSLIRPGEAPVLLSESATPQPPRPDLHGAGRRVS